eukprot:8399149-Alexandrium_andersonii.AAC.1
MSASLVGSEMCIRDRLDHRQHGAYLEPAPADVNSSSMRGQVGEARADRADQAEAARADQA